MSAPAQVSLADTLVEIPWIISGAFAYPYAIREVSLFAGQWYQFPITHPLLIGLAFVGPALLLSHSLRFTGRNPLFAGSEGLRGPAQHISRLLAGVGFVSVMMLIFAIATAALSLAGGPPPDLPAFLRVQ
ncbi:spirocyclase AveC family protein [Amycolatopsis minnesotensis]|uniref:Uncharacterized protein n=1 Tax=Amycolatopsis minnesotensis TaxID=337894 RepID=A0ABP5E6P6_9PSEU